MATFDKNMTLLDRLNSYPKESLKLRGASMGFSKLYKLKKGEIAQMVCDYLLDPEVMYKRMAILSDGEMETMEMAMEDKVPVSAGRGMAVKTLGERDLVAVSGDEFLVPSDLSALYKKIKTKDFEEYRKKASWVWKCFHFAEDFYGVTPTDKLLKLVNIKEGIKISKTELTEIFEKFPKELLWSAKALDSFIYTPYISNPEILENLKQAQGDKDYYLPTVAEVDEYCETGVLVSDEAYKALYSYMVGNLNMNPTSGAYLIIDLWKKNAHDEEPIETLQWLSEMFAFTETSQFQGLTALFMEASDNTRKLVNRGHKPCEIPDMEDENGVPLPGSTLASQLLASNAASTMGGSLGGQSKDKKVYPNDPCPCGSGVKYKKCCGKK